MRTERPHPTHCRHCGYILQPYERVKNQRHPSWVCDGCGANHPDLELRAKIEARWIARGRPRYEPRPLPEMFATEVTRLPRT
jgi:hypothetical protein